MAAGAVGRVVCVLVGLVSLTNCQILFGVDADDLVGPSKGGAGEAGLAGGGGGQGAMAGAPGEGGAGQPGANGASGGGAAGQGGPGTFDDVADLTFGYRGVVFTNFLRDDLSRVEVDEILVNEGASPRGDIYAGGTVRLAGDVSGGVYIAKLFADKGEFNSSFSRDPIGEEPGYGWDFYGSPGAEFRALRFSLGQQRIVPSYTQDSCGETFDKVLPSGVVSDNCFPPTIDLADSGFACPPPGQRRRSALFAGTFGHPDGVTTLEGFWSAVIDASKGIRFSSTAQCLTDNGSTDPEYALRVLNFEALGWSGVALANEAQPLIDDATESMVLGLTSSTGDGAIGLVRVHGKWAPPVADVVLDALFGSTPKGRVLRRVDDLDPTSKRTIRALARDAAGGLYVAVEIDAPAAPAGAIAKFLADGSELDADFAQGGVIGSAGDIAGAWSCLAVDARQRLWAFGANAGQGFAARYTTGGVPDTTFATAGRVDLPFEPGACRAYANGVLVGGSHLGTDGKAAFALARLRAD